MKCTLIIILIVSFACKSNNHGKPNGLNFPTSINPKDSNFICYPLLDSLGTEDSFWTAQLSEGVYPQFNEANLSLKPALKPIIRIAYLFEQDIIFITLSENKITVKELISGVPYPTLYDSFNLRPIQRNHLRILQLHFPLNAHKKPYQKRYCDSLALVYPELLNPSYYKMLMNAAFEYEDMEFQYQTTVTPITENTYSHLLNQFHNNGFWQLPHHIKCRVTSTGTASLILEGNSGSKYQFVETALCNDDPLPVFKACEALVKFAGLNNKIYFGRYEIDSTIAVPGGSIIQTH
jgi:hypothetical protein